MIGARGIALMNHSNVPTNISQSVYKESHRTATMINVLIVIDIYGKQATRYDHFCGRHLLFAKQIRSWGEAGVVKTRIWSTPKISERGTVCMVVGYNYYSGSYVYRMWHLEPTGNIGPGTSSG